MLLELPIYISKKPYIPMRACAYTCTYAGTPAHPCSNGAKTVTIAYIYFNAFALGFGFPSWVWGVFNNLVVWLAILASSLRHVDTLATDNMREEFRIRA